MRVDSLPSEPGEKTSIIRILLLMSTMRNFPGGPVVKSLLSNVGDASLTPGWGVKAYAFRAAKSTSGN